MTTRFTIHPIANENCDSVNESILVGSTDDIETAKDIAASAPYPFGCGILDTATGEIDVGFGFGVPCPEFSD